MKFETTEDFVDFLHRRGMDAESGIYYCEDGSYIFYCKSTQHYERVPEYYIKNRRIVNKS